MRKASVVIGLGFGDEGKGLVTDYLCSKADNPIVVRFSGGQQAGHTVHFDGKSHIHSNFGSGTLRGIPSYFTEHTTFYPVTVQRERAILEEKGVTPRLTIHPLAKMTTPFDVYANRQDEANKSHGTCGIGVGKTMKRDESPYKLYAVDLLGKREILAEKVYNIGFQYYGFTKEEINANEGLLNELEDFFTALDNWDYDVKNYNHLRGHHLIFEGSQGILLDQDHGVVFPNVTYAHTTSRNALAVCEKIGIDPRTVEVYCVTRCYSTRHGNGWFHKEINLDLVNNDNETNENNKYQGPFKVSEIDYDMINYAWHVEHIYSPFNTKHLVVTCLDQRPDFEFDYTKLAGHYTTQLESRGPSADTIKIVNALRFIPETLQLETQ